jgi:hypothetical protein
MEESNIYINQCQDISTLIPSNRMVQYPLYSKALSNNPLMREPPVVATHTEKLYGETMIQNKQNNLIKHFGNDNSVRRKEEVLSRNGSHPKSATKNAVKEESQKESDSDSGLFEDSDDYVQVSVKKEEDQGNAPSQLIDIKLNLGNDNGHLHKRETMGDDSDDDSLFVSLPGKRH